jgi:hypothetical protein
VENSRATLAIAFSFWPGLQAWAGFCKIHLWGILILPRLLRFLTFGDRATALGNTKLLAQLEQLQIALG